MAQADSVFQVGMWNLEALEVWESRWFSVGWQVGLTGTLLGAATGFVLGTFACGDEIEGCDGHAAGVSLRYAFVFGSMGAAIGGFIGSRQSKWKALFP